MKPIAPAVICLFALLACQDMQSQKEADILVTSSGYRYQIFRDVAGAQAQPGSYVLVHSKMAHRDSLISDTRINPAKATVVKIEMDLTSRRGGSGPIQDLLLLLSVGDSARIYYPLDSFPTKPPRLKHLDEVTYDIVVLEIYRTDAEYQAYLAEEREKINAPRREMKEREEQVAAQLAQIHAAHKSGAKDNVWQTTSSGLKYIVLEKSGTGVKAKQGETVRTHYYGILESDGTKFDNSYSRGNTLDFSLGTGQMIKGFDEAFGILEKGDRAVILVPGSLAYGPQGYPGVIPPNASLIFYLEFVGIGDVD